MRPQVLRHAPMPARVSAGSVAPRWWRALLVMAMVLALTPSSPPPAQGAFPGRNGLIAYQARSGTTFQIFTITPDGANRTQITSGGSSYTPSFSPDGRTLVVFRDAGTRSGVWTVDLQGTWIRKLAAFPANMVETTHPAWSPAGDQVVFTRTPSDPTEAAQLWIVGSDGSDPHRVDFAAPDELEPTAIYSPVWSPDGTKIAFTGYDPVDERFHVYTVAPDGSDLAALTTGETSDPSWSPDGAHIVYTRAARGNSDLSVMNADGTNKMSLTATRMSEGREGWGAWSPDGSKIAFYDQARGALFTIKPDGSGRRVLRSNVDNGEGVPDWQPDTRDPSSITLNYSVDGDTEASGEVSPNVAGQEVIVKLFAERDGRWERIATKRPVLDSGSRYVTSFTTPVRDWQCRLTARYPGSSTLLPSVARKDFLCWVGGSG